MKIHGLNECLKRLQFDDKEIGKALQLGGELILSQAKTTITPQEGEVANSYDMFVTRDDQGWIVNVGSDLDLSAFFEFGTGDFVVVPPETTDAYTMNWFVNGKGTLHPVPHLYPAYRENINRVVDLLNNELRRQF